ncbi:MAG TPA: RNA 2',3'-cyclic phosphodiesterase [Bacteroidota bacterium]|nr:RNA 2',3'-cyclic phosphodiesterase [Bacteroidota bacterium]
MATLRIFIAVDTPAEVRAQIAALRDGIARECAGVRWEATAKFHCTLQFLGNVPGVQMAAVERSVAAAASGSPALLLGYRGIGFFPEGARPRVIWVGVHDATGTLLRLQEEVARGLEREGFAREERPFHPHVTLGRLPAAHPPHRLIEIAESRTFEHPPVVVPAVEIMQSVTGSRGTSYAVLRSIPLSGGGTAR